MNAIELKGLTKEYKNFKLDNITFNLPAGSIVGLIGENGAGKSTIINLIMGALNKTSGTVDVLGKSTEKNFDQTKQDIGIVLDESCFMECINACQIEKIMKNTYTNWDSETYFSFMDKFSLPKDKQFKTFSRGMKMKLAIAVSLSHHAKLLILDEATSGLDPVVRDEILDVFFEFVENGSNSILMSSHIVSDLEKICDYIAFVHKGKLILFEEKDTLLDKYKVVKCTKDEFEKIDKCNVEGYRKNEYGVEFLMQSKFIPRELSYDNATIENIIVFLAKKESR